MLSPPSASVHPMRPSMNANNANYASFYDPISPGSSRRSSEMSNTTTGGQCLIPPPPSSHLLTSHLQRLQQSSFANPLYNTNRLSVPSISTIGSELSSVHDIGALHMNQCVPDRRMSEPVNFGANEKSPPQRPRSLTPTKLTSDTNTPAVTTGKYYHFSNWFAIFFSYQVHKCKCKCNYKNKKNIKTTKINENIFSFNSNQCGTTSKS